MEKLRAYLKGRREGDFADQIGISKPYLSQIKHGRKLPSYRLMVEIERATGGCVDLYCWSSGAGRGGPAL